jgi:threonine/homoserine/homoserine lactone efflux protein
MLWLAWKTFKSSSVIEENHTHNGFLSGLILQFINPKIYIYCIVSMEAYILPFYQGEWNALVFFALLLAFIGFIFTVCWSLFGAVFKLLFSKYAKITNAIMALLLVYCAISLFI